MDNAMGSSATGSGAGARPHLRRGRGGRPAESRQRLIDAASTLFGQKGYSGTTVDDIAAEAAISRGSLFWHFGTKEQLLWAVIDDVFLTWANTGLVEAVGDATGLAAVRRALRSHREMLRHNRDVWRLYHVLMGEALGPRVSMAPTFVELHQHFRALAESWIGEAVAAGEATVGDPAAMAAVAVSAMSGFAGHWLFEPEAIELDRCYDQLVRTIELGLGATPGA